MKKEEYQRRRELGLCSQCSNISVTGRTMCSACIIRHTERYRNKHKKGVCFNCDSPAEIGKTRCDACAEKQRLAAHARRQMRRQSGNCISCGQIAKARKRYCVDCLKQHKLQRDDYKIKGLCQSCGKPTQGKARCIRCLAINKQSVYRLKLEVFNAYGGPVCNCCGESHIEFLALDHINNDGAEHRRQVKSSGVYRSLRKQRFPVGYQVLCHNCNWARYVYGECPHIKEKENVVARPRKKETNPPT